MPSSCNRIEPRAVSTADSLSRAFAASFPVDTLQFIDTVQPGKSALSYPRTIAYAPNGTLWVTDTAQHILLTLSPDEDNLVSRDTLPDTFPYMAGFRGSSAYVFSPATHHVYEMGVLDDVGAQGAPRLPSAAGVPRDTSTPRMPSAAGVPRDTSTPRMPSAAGGPLEPATPAEIGVIREIELQGGIPKKGGLRYAVVTDSGFAIKVVADGFASYVAEANDNGEILSSYPIAGPEWRYAGQIRTHNGAIYSLAGYLPLMDVFAEGKQDSLNWMGFDSPMLARTRQFQLGDTSQPPLLSASAALAADHWFVLNMRPGWIQVDVYSLEGQLRYILTQPDPSFNQEFFPTDIAVHPDETGGFYIAIALIKPDPRIDRFYWHP